MQLRKPGVVLCVLIAMTGTAAAAQEAGPAPTGDPRVAETLKAAGLAYRLDVGDYRLNYDLEGGRSQRVWVASGTGRLDQLELRDVWSVAARGTGAVPPQLASLLLTENARMIVGAWQLNQRNDEYLVVLSAPISATADATTLREVVEVIALSADRIEKQLSDEDAF